MEKLHFQKTTDATEVLEIFKDSPSYFENVEGATPSLEIAENEINSHPKKTTEKYFKEFLIICKGEEKIGTVDLYLHHPKESTVYIGLLLIREKLWGKGLGKKSFQELENHIANQINYDKILLGVSQDNDVSNFWKKLGFAPNGETYHWKGENKVTEVTEFEKKRQK